MLSLASIFFGFVVPEILLKALNGIQLLCTPVSYKNDSSMSLCVTLTLGRSSPVYLAFVLLQQIGTKVRML